MLRITINVVTLSNAAGSFKPFDMSEALGNATPTQPPPKPKKSKWGILGQFLIAIVAIVVAWFVGPWVTSFLGTGTATATAVGYAVGAAVGSAASQGVAIALDIQDSFSWKAVGSAALTGLIAPYLVSTLVHEGTHQSRFFRGARLGTQYDEYVAFRNEALFNLGRRPTLVERQVIWREVQQLYPELPSARVPVGGWQ